MPRNLEQMGVEAIIKHLPQYLTGMGKMGESTQKTQGIIGKIGGIAKGAIGGIFKIGAAAGAAAIGGIAALSGAMFKLASDAAPIAGIKQSFDELTASMEGGSKAVLAALQEQSAGMVTNTDLMKSYNLASLLIGESFTKQLPDAMGFVGKVALATGEDMGFLMDSLVRGIGRLSPMILDNLGITVNLTDAYEAFAKKNGLVASEMTKAEQQAALMEQTMAALAEKTAGMPEVAGSAQQSFKSFSVQMRNFKDELGLVILPVVSDMVGSFSEMGEKIFPQIIDFVKKNLLPVFEKVGWVLSAVADAGLGSTEMWEALSSLLGDETTESLRNVWEWLETNIPKAFKTVKQFWEETLKPAFEDIVDFVKTKLIPAFTDLGTGTLSPLLADLIELGKKIGNLISETFGREEYFDIGLGVISKGPKKKADLIKFLEELDEILFDFLLTKFPEHWKNFRDWVLDFLGLPNWVQVADSWRGVWDNIETIVDTAIENIKALINDFLVFWTDFFTDIGLVAKALTFDPLAIQELLGGEFGPPPSTLPSGSSSIMDTPTSTGPIMLPPVAPLSNAPNYNLTIHTSAPVEPIVEDFRLMRAMGERP